MPKRLFVATMAENNIVYGITKSRTLFVENGRFIQEKHVIIPEKVNGMLVVGINEQAFEGTKIQSIILPESVKEIDSYAFARCEKLKQVTMYAPIVYLGGNAFSQCCELRKVFGNHIGTTSSRAFWKCSKLEKIDAIFFGGVFSQTFGACSNLKELTFKNAHFYHSVFWGCKSLKTLYFYGDISAPEKELDEIAKYKIVCEATSPLIELGYSGASIKIM